MRATQRHNALIVVKLLHTVAWAFFAGCIIAIPLAAWRGERVTPVWLIAAVAFEVIVLLVNRWSCPLTSVAASYTEDRQANLDIYLPLWLARHSRTVFGFLYVAGIVIALVRWAIAE